MYVLCVCIYIYIYLCSAQLCGYCRPAARCQRINIKSNYIANTPRCATKKDRKRRRENERKIELRIHSAICLHIIYQANACPHTHKWPKGSPRLMSDSAFGSHFDSTLTLGPVFILSSYSPKRSFALRA